MKKLISMAAFVAAAALAGCATMNDSPVKTMDGVLVGAGGMTQLAYKGKPLYYWIKDTKPGDKTGDGVNQVWRTARP